MSATPLPGVIIVFSGAGSTVSASDGTYSITVPYNYSGTGTPQLTDAETADGEFFSPQSTTFTNVTTGLTGQDFTLLDASASTTTTTA
jgi:hypothetical protein